MCISEKDGPILWWILKIQNIILRLSFFHCKHSNQSGLKNWFVDLLNVFILNKIVWYNNVEENRFFPLQCKKLYTCSWTVDERIAQHDELKSNLKKILHRNRIWGLELGSYCHVVSPTNLKKFRFRSPGEKNHETSFLKVLLCL